ncbi:MAG: TIGR01777 family oxidoreductase, partial [Candidatus Thermoplasmatota archaeon]|nr:TIGR01777 family oxidoreductase [Candidatus Thermoplasmatota archaeon]
PGRMGTLITGGTGAIGRKLRASLELGGEQVYVASRTPGDASTIVWDPKTSGSLEIPEDVTRVVHMAGAPIVGARWTKEYKQEILTSRVKGTRTVVQAIKAHGGIDHLLSGSAIGYYGDQGEQRLTESAAPGDDFLADVCQAWEQEALKANTVSPGTTVTLARTGVVLDPEDGALAQMLNPFWIVKPFHWGLGGPLGSGRQWFPWIHVEDEVRALAFLLKQPVEGPVNLTAPNPVRNKVYTKALGKVLHRPTLLPIPKFAIQLLYGGAADLLFASQRVLPARLEAEGFTFQHPEIEAALHDLLG